jgi:hypothetical protein
MSDGEDKDFPGAPPYLWLSHLRRPSKRGTGAVKYESSNILGIAGEASRILRWIKIRDHYRANGEQEFVFNEFLTIEAEPDVGISRSIDYSETNKPN